MIRKFVSLAVVLIVASLLSACASSRMVDLAQPPLAVAQPVAGTATVVFMRPSLFGGAIQSSVFDITDGGDSLVGIVSAGKKVAASTAPGHRRFMVIGESADFMDAELAAGKTYHARVEPRLGIWKARFSLVPVLSDSPDLAGDLASCAWVDNTPMSRQWAAESVDSISAKRIEYLPDWEKDPAKAILPISAGR